MGHVNGTVVCAKYTGDLLDTDRPAILLTLSFQRSQYTHINRLDNYNRLYCTTGNSTH